MGFFSLSGDTVITDEVETATSDKTTEEDWGQIITICDKAGKTSENAKQYLKAIIKRLYNDDPHVGIKAVTLLDACIKNSGKTFHLEVASRDFENEFTKLMTKAQKPVSKKLRESLKKWAENEFKSDSSLTLIPSLYSKLKNSGYDFSSSDTPKKSVAVCKDPNVVETQEEEDQILKAIELSLKEQSGSPKTTSTSLYPSVNMSNASAAVSSAPQFKEPRKVRALYDFEAAEDNELTFNSGEIIFVLDDSDPNWWKGSNQRGEGLFPANFVTSDLSAEPEKYLYEKAKKMVLSKENNETVAVKQEQQQQQQQEIEINEEKIDRLLHLLHEADPTNPEHDTEEMLKLESEVNRMGPLIDSELERVDRSHAQLSKLSNDLVQALSLYHLLMREPQTPFQKPPYGYNPPPTSAFNGVPPPNMPPQMMGPPRSADRPSFMPPTGHYMSLPPPGSAPGNMHVMPPQPQTPMGSQAPDERPPMPHFPHPMPNFMPPNVSGASFQQPILQQPPMQSMHNGIQQQPPAAQPQPQLHYVTSSTHMMH